MTRSFQTVHAQEIAMRPDANGELLAASLLQLLICRLGRRLLPDIMKATSSHLLEWCIPSLRPLRLHRNLGLALGTPHLQRGGKSRVRSPWAHRPALPARCGKLRQHIKREHRLELVPLLVHSRIAALVRARSEAQIHSRHGSKEVPHGRFLHILRVREVLRLERRADVLLIDVRQDGHSLHARGRFLGRAVHIDHLRRLYGAAHGGRAHHIQLHIMLL
mmetsp:Transcript_94982/g.178707  ORF Transcript_94982/g.178707 Transcript_94982/m.178707 type:complete len:219 (+) Transcript_94982:235-891(+)